MATCQTCRKEMNVDSCVLAPVRVKGRNYTPIRFGHEQGRWSDFPTDRCPDFAVKKGGYHHPGCDVERCPVCGRQLISCGCAE